MIKNEVAASLSQEDCGLLALFDEIGLSEMLNDVFDRCLFNSNCFGNAPVIDQSMGVAAAHSGFIEFE